MDEYKSLGIMEYRSVAIGMKAADSMLKAADIRMMMMQTVCPGKYIVMFTGKLSSVEAAVKVGRIAPFDEVLVDSYLLGNPDQSLFAAIYGTCDKENLAAIGILEGYAVASMVGVADEIVKTSPVRLIELRLARGMTGKSYAIFAGEIAAVEASMKKAESILVEVGLFLHSAGIPSPDPVLWEML